jgi:hypothetical protein
MRVDDTRGPARIRSCVILKQSHEFALGRGEAAGAQNVVMLAAAGVGDNVGRGQESHVGESRLHRLEPLHMFEMGHDDLVRRRVNLLSEAFEAFGQQVGARDCLRRVAHDPDYD